MSIYPFADTKKWKILFAMLMAGLLYFCRDSMFTTAILGFNKSYLLTVLLVCTAGIVFLIYNRKQWKKLLADGRLVLIFAVTVILLIPMVLKRDWQMMYVSVLFCLYVGIFFSFFWDYRDAAKCYVLLFTAIGVYSVVATYLLRIFPDRGIFSVPVFYNSEGELFHNFFISIVSDEYVKTRNFGIFREPGVHQYFVLLALFLNNCTVRWEKQSRMWLVNILLSVVMLSTFATGGIVELALLAVFVFFDKKLYRSKTAWIIVGVLAALLAVALVVIIAQRGEIYWTLYGTFVYKFQPGQASSSERVDAILHDLGFFLRNPLAGGSLNQVFDVVPNNTTSTMLMFAIFGFFGGALHLVSWLALVWEKDRPVLLNLAVFVIMAMSFNTQNLIADVFLWLLPMMALCQRGLPLARSLKAKEIVLWKKKS